MTDKEFFDELKNDETILEKLYGDISSFNFFRRNVGYKHDWVEGKLKARGLFLSNKTYEIVARSYDKFFAINERDFTSLDSLKDKFIFPLDVYLKENGYLGLVGYDKYNDSLIFASKASIGGPFALLLEEIFKKKVKEIDKVKEFLKNEKVSMVFEVIDPIRDPHVIEYKEENIVLLDVVYREPVYRKKDYEELLTIGKTFNLSVKEKIKVINNYEEFLDWYNEVTAKDYKLNEEYIEGFVIEDANKYMVKLKLDWYLTWKRMRRVKDKMFKPEFDESSLELNETQKEFFEWFKKMGKDYLKGKDIITLRKEFLKQK